VTESTGAAALAGIEPGDIVLAINGTPVQTPEQLRAAMRGTGSTAAVLVQRGAAEIFVPVAIEVASN
jgi:serine protease Do